MYDPIEALRGLYLHFRCIKKSEVRKPKVDKRSVSRQTHTDGTCGHQYTAQCGSV